MSGRRLFSSPVHTACLLLLLLLVALFFANCHAKRSHQHCDQYRSSSCGNIHNISYPFRFKGDPENCGKRDYELVCENNRPVLYLFSGKFYVQAINDNNYTIRLVDEGIQIGNRSSLPLHPFTYDNFTSQKELPYNPFRYHYDLVNSVYDAVVVVFMNCENPVKSPFYIETSSSSASNNNNKSSSSFASPRSRQYSYVLLGSLRVAYVEDLCTIDKMTMTGLSSPPGESQAEGNFSLLDVHNMLAYGFELSWRFSLCEKCRGGDYCFVDAVDYTVMCYKYCHGPLFNSSFICVLEMIAQKYIVPGLQLKFWRIGNNGSINRVFLICICFSFLIGWILVARTSCGMLCLFVFLIYKFKRRHLSMFDTIEGFLQSQNNLMPIRYSYLNIKKMTKGFKDKLGEGGYGSVYKGKLRSGNAVAIKILGKSKANGQDFINEVATIGRIHHVNVVQLIGFCAERSKRALLYDFMPNGSLEKYIFSHQEGSTSLSCKQMFEISLGVARGIEYLHRGCDMQILHFDIKPHNILLDENFTPKVSDFGLAKLYPTENSIVSLTAARGTMGYMAPELFYKNIGPISYKADVYSFGMLLMEMAGRRRNLNVYADHASQIYFPSWVYDQFKEGRDVEVGAATEEERQMVKKMIITALWCIQMKPSDRPSMNKVVEMLEGNIELLEMPPKPFLTPQEMPVAAEDH